MPQGKNATHGDLSVPLVQVAVKQNVAVVRVKLSANHFRSLKTELMLMRIFK